MKTASPIVVADTHNLIGLQFGHGSASALVNYADVAGRLPLGTETVTGTDVCADITGAR